ncbi:hypothetical protein HRG84_23625 [Flavisolibacter sp. BT320]|nr:hypothetical protein [Flavisolibacter longurius]
MQSNPIQQRIELIAEKWEESKAQSGASVMCLQCVPDELEMADTFYTYMIAADSPISDIAFHFDARCFDPFLFSQALLEELKEVLHIWNHSAKDDRIEFVPVDWQPDDSFQDHKNPAQLFVHNFNRLADAVGLPEGFFAVAIFRNASLDKSFASWVGHALEAGIDQNIKFLVHELKGEFRYGLQQSKFPDAFHFIPLNLNMPQAMEQVAAMGDPLDPGTAYRHAFMKMINAMGANKELVAEKHGASCLAMATENLSRDPYWLMQVVAVNIALGNDKIRYKKKKETLIYADNAVTAALAAPSYLDKQATETLLSQALMFRGTVQYMQARWGEACTDFSTAFTLYLQLGNMPLAIEASRMGGQCALKSSQKKAGIKLWVAGAKLGEKMDSETARASTYAELLKNLLATDMGEEMAIGELHALAQRIYGEDWAKVIRNPGKTPNEINTTTKAELAAIE